ncbi:MAG: hypothetical protein K0S33_1795 [Bacteroidetes bacterium]|jgi:hypothetical protein|nr:hypothetical protein [Bacteroidota bacterium]
MRDKDPIDENKLDELLRAHSLDKGADESLAEAVLSQEYNVPVNAAKETAMLNKLDQNINRGNKNWPFIYGGIVVIIVAALAIYAATSKRMKPNESYAIAEPDKVTQTSDKREEVQTNTNDQQKPAVKTDTFEKTVRLYPVVYKDSTQPAAQSVITRTVVPKPGVLPYFKLSDNYLYTKIKQQMLEKLYNADKGLYTHVAANKMEYAGKPAVIDGFTIRNVAVTNLEYKTFMADLLARNRAADYFKVEVLALKWKQDGYSKMSDMYFQDHAYNDFPVVNISAEGARLFCKWIEEELKLYIQTNKLKSKNITIRLPTDREWILAARDGIAKISFETGYNTIYEPREGLVDFSFVKRMHQIRKKSMAKDTLYPLYISNRYGWEEERLIGFLVKGFNVYNDAPMDTIYPDRMKVRGKIGHVSEMVPQFGASRVWLSGLTWKSKEEYDAFESAFKTSGVSPFVTFRFVMIDAEEPAYKAPFW